MRGLAILILIVVFFWLVGPAISRWIKRKAMERAEDYLRSSMGMPPRDKSRRKSQRGDENYSGTYSGSYSKNYSGHTPSNEPLIPKEYAEDVEFVETTDYSQKETREEGRIKKQYHESQISDVEFTEIKKSNTK